MHQSLLLHCNVVCFDGCPAELPTTLFPTGDLISVLGLVSTMLQPKVLPTLAPREKLSWKEKLTILV